jgi:hypothetical protein
VAEDWIRDEESANRIRERTARYSTQAKYSSKPAALLMDYYEYNKHERVSCPVGDWSGQAGQASIGYRDELFDVSCPVCGTMLLIVVYPTTEQTREAAAAGNAEAIAELPRIEAMEERWRRANELELKPDSDLPVLEGDQLNFIWDFEQLGDEPWTLIRHGDVVVWRELAYWEGWKRFNAVTGLLKARFGERFGSLRPTSASENYLYGDDLGAPERLTTT